MEVDLAILLALFATAIIAAAIDILAGGGGLLTIPALMWAGITPIEALATNKCQAVVGSSSASIRFYRQKAFKWSQMRSSFMFAFVGSVLGTWVVQLIDTKQLAVLIPWAMIAVAIYMAVAKQPKEARHPPRLSPFVFGLTFGLAIGFYDGMFGPGTGSFLCVAYVLVQGYGLQEATIRAKVLNFASNIASCLAFALTGHVIWTIGLLMGIGAFIGARIGSHLVLSPNGFKWIKPVMIVMSILMAGKLLITA